MYYASSMLQMQNGIGEMFWVTILLLYVYIFNTMSNLKRNSTAHIYFKSFLLFCTRTLLLIFSGQNRFWTWQNLQNLKILFSSIDLTLPDRQIHQQKHNDAWTKLQMWLIFHFFTISVVDYNIETCCTSTYKVGTSKLQEKFCPYLSWS